MAPVPRAGMLAGLLEAPHPALRVVLLEGVLHVGPLVLIPGGRRVHRPFRGKGFLAALARALAPVVVRHLVRVPAPGAAARAEAAFLRPKAEDNLLSAARFM